MEQNHEKALLLGRENVGRLILKFSLPAIAATIATSLYNIIAGIFIGHLGAYSIAGVGLTMPFMNLALAFGLLLSVGASVLCSIDLGKKAYDAARHVLGSLIVLDVILGIAFAVIGLIFLDPILLFFGASANTLAPAREYMQIILAGNVFAYLFQGMNAILRVSGYPMIAMGLTLISVVINTALTPLFIFGFDMGVAGAAWATVAAQAVCTAVEAVLLSRKDKTVYFERGKFRPDLAIVRHTVMLGSPIFFTNAANCFIVILENYNFLKFGNDLYVGAFSIINRIASLFFMIVVGLTQGMQPIVAYNYGAGLYKRMWQTFRLVAVSALIVTTVGMIVCQGFPEVITRLFVDGSAELDSSLIAVTVDGFRKVTLCFWVIGFAMIGSNYFSCMNQPGKSLFLSLTRQVIFIVPLLFILPPIFGTDGVWYTMPVTDMMAAVCTAILVWREWRIQKRRGLLV